MRKFTFAILAVTLVSLLYSCAGEAPVKAKPDDCLVVIKSELTLGKDVDAAHRDARQYFLNLSSNYKPMGMRIGYSMTVIREPAVRVLSVSSVLPGNYIGGGSSNPINGNMFLPYASGTVAIADFVFVRRIEKYKDNGYMEYFSFREITDSERAELMEKIRSDPDLSSWKL